MGVWGDAALELCTAGFLPIPAENKHPCRKHKPENGGQPKWTREKAVVEAKYGTFDRVGDLGILCDRGLFIVDFDTQEAYDTWRLLAPAAFDATVTVRTRKGVHAWFMRTPECDELGVFDGPLGFVTDPGGGTTKYPIDIKTITSVTSTVKVSEEQSYLYHTPGFCSLPPSPHKAWVRCPFGPGAVPILPVPSEVVARITLERGNNINAAACGSSLEKRRRVPPSRARSPPPPAADQFVFTWRPNIELDLPDLRTMGFDTARLLNVSSFTTSNQNLIRLGYLSHGVYWFKAQKEQQCPLCLRTPGHNNGYWVAHRSDGERRISNYSSSCVREDANVKSARTIAWSAASIALHLARFVSFGTALSTVQRDALGRRWPALMAHSTAGWVTRGSKLYVQQAAAEEDGSIEVVEVAYGVRDRTSGWPTVRITNKPFVPGIGAFTVAPLPASFFEML
jgi:hypothetical protein